MQIKDRYNSKHFDKIIYTVSEIKILSKYNLLLSDGTVINKKNFSWGSTFKLCVNQLSITGKITCSICGTEATILRRDIEKSTPQGNITWHFYGIKDGSYELFTKDHIIPKSLDKNFFDSSIALENRFVPACESCNQLRGNTYSNLSDEERSKEAAIIKRMKWIRSTFLNNMFDNLLMKNKEYKAVRKQFMNNIFSSENLRNYVLSLESTDFNLIDPKQYNITFSSDKERDVINSFVFQTYRYKNPMITDFNKKFQSLLFQDFLKGKLKFS